MIQRHNHCIPFLCQICSVIRGKLLTTAGGITSTMQPHHDGAFLPVFQSRCPDIHPQTILVRITVIPVEGKRLLVAVPSHALALRTSRAISTAAADAFPFISGHGRHKTFGFGIWDTFIYIDTISTYPATFPDSVSAMAVAEEAVISPSCPQADAFSILAVPPHEESRMAVNANTDKNCFSYYVLVLCFMIAILAHSPQKDFLRYPNGFPRCSKQLSPMFKCLQICSKHALRQSLSQFL